MKAEQTEEKHEFWKMKSAGMLTKNIKNSKKKEKAMARDMPSSGKKISGFWKVWRKELRKVLAIPLEAYPLFAFHSGSYWEL